MKKLMCSGDLTPELGYILGVAKGDAWVGKYVLELMAIDKDFVDEFKKTFERYFNVEMVDKIKHDRRYPGWVGFLVRTCSIEICKFIKNFDIKRIFQASNEVKSMFLKGFYDSEGFIRKSTKSSDVGINNTNLELIKMSKRLLSDLGIETTRIFITHRKGGRKTLYYIFIRKWRENLLRFKNDVGFSIERKMDKLNILIKNCRNYSPKDYEGVMELRKNDLSSIGISKITGIKECVINKWIYYGQKPQAMWGYYVEKEKEASRAQTP